MREIAKWADIPVINLQCDVDHPGRITGEVLRQLDQFDLYPANQYVTSRGKLEPAIAAIKAELDERVAFFEKNEQFLEAQRIRMRTQYDLEMLAEVGRIESAAIAADQTLKLLLVGDPQLTEILDREELEILSQRVALSCRLEPL